MVSTRCPICHAPTDRVADADTWPFCSGRCRSVDLGRWLDGGYSLADGALRSAPLDDEGAEP
ncbi:MAG: DNA gyrase inhibitor YacG [Myxococcales bacterium]|nr:DNA gyrase inhibitor YacG [Myxococcales bacterium]